MYNLYLVRHGESIQNIHENVNNLPDHAIPLTNKGIEEARSAGKFLYEYLHDKFRLTSKNIAMYCSPYTRTRQTAKEIMGYINFDPESDLYQEDDMLVEMNFGLFHNVPKSEIKKTFPEEWKRYQNERRYCGKFFARRPNGESPLDVAVRQKLFLGTLFRDISKFNFPEHIVIVGHGAAFNVLRKCIFHMEYDEYEKLKNPSNCSIQHIVINPNHKNIYLGYIYGQEEI